MLTHYLGSVIARNVIVGSGRFIKLLCCLMENKMEPVNEIYANFLLGNVKFHKAMESDIFRDSLMFHMANKYSTSASLGAVLYEMVFTTRLVRETANPSGFIPSKNNVEQQFENLINREDEVINVERLSFRKITQQLVETSVITEDEKMNMTHSILISKIQSRMA